MQNAPFKAAVWVRACFYLIAYQVFNNNLKFVELTRNLIVMLRSTLMLVAVSNSPLPIASDLRLTAMVVDGTCFVYDSQAARLDLCLIGLL
jgi:hypothetical protein